MFFYILDFHFGPMVEKNGGSFDKYLLIPIIFFFGHLLIHATEKGLNNLLFEFLYNEPCQETTKCKFSI